MIKVVRSRWLNVFDNSVFSRFWLLAGILGVECGSITMVHHPWLQGGTSRFAITFLFVAALFFGQDNLRAMREQVPPIQNGWLALHVVGLTFFAVDSFYLLHFQTTGSIEERQFLVAWYLFLAIVPVTLVQALFGIPQLLRVLIALGAAWGSAALCVGLMVLTRYDLMAAWDTPNSVLGHTMQRTTFKAVKVLLQMIYPAVVADGANFIIGTAKFSVEITGLCSGLEGLALGLSLSVGWLIFSWRELRLARAWVLVPLSLSALLLLNVVRIVALIAIGTAGYPMVAIGGFHSEAGGLLFCCVALVFLLLVNKVVWFRTKVETRLAPSIDVADFGEKTEINYAAVYLLPFLSVLAAGLVATAGSDGFERMYALRLIAAVGVLWIYRSQYMQINWLFGWEGPTAGVLIFAAWIWLNRFYGPGATDTTFVSNKIAEGLGGLTRGQRISWIAMRTIAAVVTVPIVEELAFRGYLARRLVARNVDCVRYGSLGVVAIGGSSLIFGLLHGKTWVAGTLAGICYAMVAKRRGRLGEAVAAHATTNLCLAAWILTHGEFQLW